MTNDELIQYIKTQLTNAYDGKNRCSVNAPINMRSHYDGEITAYKAILSILTNDNDKSRKLLALKVKTNDNTRKTN